MKEQPNRVRRRMVAAGTAGVAGVALALAAGTRQAAAQQGKSTWEVVTGTKKLRLGAAISEPFAFKDLENSDEMIAAFQSNRVQAISSSLTGMTLASGRMPNTIVAMPTPPALFPATAAIRNETDPRWRNFLTTSFGYLAYSGFVQKQLDYAYAFRGVDITKVQPVVIR